ncbi:MAG: MFS transporter [Planctomycetes bacterium]|nr:MFS transporter [Planctomycetota bacterium]
MRTSNDRSIAGLLVAQVLGAFNDNAFKFVAALLAVRAIEGVVPAGPELEFASQSAMTTAFVVFTLPLMLFSLPASVWIDRISKRSILVATKGLEILLMALGTVALRLAPEGGLPVLVILAAMGAQSALFSPAKYGILPEILSPRELIRGNGRIETWTMVAIIAGTASAGHLLDLTSSFDGGPVWWIGLFLTANAVVGFAAILRLPEVPPASAALPIRTVVGEAWRAVRDDRVLWLASAGSVFFWAIASLVSQDALVYAKARLSLGVEQAPLPLAASGVGVALGAYLVGKLSRGRVDTGWIPLGTLGITAACAAIGLSTPGFHGVVVWMAAVGVFCGWVIVPLNTLIQIHAPKSRRGAVIALVNAAQYGGILVGSLSCDALARHSIDSAGVFVAAAIATLIGTAWALWLLPQAGVRLVLVLLTQTIYRLRVRGAEHVPTDGGALLVCNHESFVDGLLISASLDRPVRFIVEKSVYDKRWLRWFMRLFGFVPIAQDAPPRELLESIRLAGEALDRGELVCIFAEGEITRTGQMLPFRRGFSRIIKGRNVPVVPVHLDRVWGSLLSFSRSKWLQIPRKITVSFGDQLPASVSGAEVRARVRELASAAWAERIEDAGPLHAEFVRSARRVPWRLAAADERVPRVSRIGLLASAVAIARELRAEWSDVSRVGVLLPPSVAGAAVNIAASLAGRTTVNLNFTTGPAVMRAAIERAELRNVVTSRAFLERVGVELPAGVEPIFCEDLERRISVVLRARSVLAALFMPIVWLERTCGSDAVVKPGDPATVIFSSGSTGDPKGVVLTHHNIGSNADGVAQAIPVTKDDRMLGSLPLFHSFGTLGLWFALRNGIATVFCANPLDAVAVGRTVQRYSLTLLIATPTFLQIYTRRCTPGQFGSLRLVVVGAEKLPARIADAFEEKFGVRPLEGYGTTECAPVVAVNAPGFRAPGFYQPASRRGTVGQPLPGISVRVVDPESRDPLPIGETGVLEVMGPNVMRGYLGCADLTAEVLHDGWYSTGDIARVDDDGYITITDRLSRFSKIGGEMVPHGRVETELQDAAGAIAQVFAVTGIPSDSKGEQLVVLHTLDESRIPEIRAELERRGLPNLFIPRESAFVQVDELPVLGTGKLDLRGVKELALARFAGD